MVKDINNEEFLAKGGILLKKGTENGQPVIKQKKMDSRWHTRITFTSEKLRDDNLRYLTDKQKQFFRHAKD